MPIGPKVSRSQVPPGTWPAFNIYLYITLVSDLGPFGPLVFAFISQPITYTTEKSTRPVWQANIHLPLSNFHQLVKTSGRVLFSSPELNM